MLIAAGVVSGVLGAALWLLPSQRLWRKSFAAAAVTIAVAMGLGWGAPEFNALLYNRGFYRDIYTGKKVDVSRINQRMLYHREGINAPVAVFNIAGVGSLRLTGKADASTAPMDNFPQLLLGHLPVLFADSPKSVGIIGFGSGMSAGAALAHPGVESLDIMEIEEAVIGAAPYFESINRNPLKDSRSRIVMEDGRIHVAYTSEIYDIIVSEPSNPWMSGVSNLFTVDFYSKVKDRLSQKGIFVQWLQLYEISPPAVKTVLASIHEVFPHMAVFQGGEWDIIVLASSQPIRRPYEEFHMRFEEKMVRESFRRVNIFNAHDVLSFFIASGDRIKAFITDAPSLNTDDNVWLEHRMPRDMVWSGTMAYAAGEEAPLYLLSNLGADYRLRSIQEMLPGLPLSDTMRGMLRYLYSTEPEIYGTEVEDIWSVRRSSIERGMRAETDGMGAPLLQASFNKWAGEESAYFDRRMQAARHLAASAGEEIEIQKRIARESFAIAPDLPATLARMGYFAYTERNYREARNHYSRVLESPASRFYYDALIGMGNVALDLGEIENAADYYRQAIDINPYLPRAFLAQATVYTRQRRIEKARETLQNGLRFNPGEQSLLRALDFFRQKESGGWW